MRPRLPQAFSPITARKLDALAASPAHLSQPSSQIVQNRRTRPATSFLTWFSLHSGRVTVTLHEFSSATFLSEDDEPLRLRRSLARWKKMTRGHRAPPAFRSTALASTLPVRRPPMEIPKIPDTTFFQALSLVPVSKNTHFVSLKACDNTSQRRFSE